MTSQPAESGHCRASSARTPRAHADRFRGLGAVPAGLAAILVTFASLTACSTDAEVSLGTETLRVGASAGPVQQQADAREQVRQSFALEVATLRADLTQLREAESSKATLPAPREALFTVAGKALASAATTLGPQRGASEANGPVGMPTPSAAPADLFGAAPKAGTVTAAAVKERAQRVAFIFETAATYAPGADAPFYAALAARAAQVAAALEGPAPSATLTEAQVQQIASAVSVSSASKSPADSPGSSASSSPALPDVLGAAANDVAQAYFHTQYYLEVSAARYPAEQQATVLATARTYGSAGSAWAAVAAKRGLTAVTREPDYAFTALIGNPTDLAAARAGTGALLVALTGRQAALLAATAPLGASETAAPSSTPALPLHVGAPTPSAIPLPEQESSWRTATIEALMASTQGAAAYGVDTDPLPGLDTSQAPVTCLACGPSPSSTSQ